MPRILIGASLLFLTLSAVFGVLNNSRMQTLRTEQANALAARDASERQNKQQQDALKEKEAVIAAANVKFEESESRIANAEAELIKTQTERADLQSRLQANDTEIAELRRRLDEAAPVAGPDGVPGLSAAELQSQLEETRRQLEGAERERNLLSEQLRTVQERSEQIEQEQKQRQLAASRPGLRGTVLAVNEAYNFVVLNLGARQGIERASEMLVLRGASLIAKIRVSSVEPATAIGDIVASSLSRGVQVQPGDNVVYAGNNP